MILGIGNDLVDIRRIEKSLERFGDRFNELLSRAGFADADRRALARWFDEHRATKFGDDRIERWRVPLGEAQKARNRQATVALEGRGVTEIGGTTLDWQANDIFVVPSFAWRRHTNQGRDDAVLYTVSDAPLMEKIGQYRAQGRLPDDAVAELVL